MRKEKASEILNDRNLHFLSGTEGRNHQQVEKPDKYRKKNFTVRKQKMLPEPQRKQLGRFAVPLNFYSQKIFVRFKRDTI